MELYYNIKSITNPDCYGSVIKLTFENSKPFFEVIIGDSDLSSLCSFSKDGAFSIKGDYNFEVISKEKVKELENFDANWKGLQGWAGGDFS